MKQIEFHRAEWRNIINHMVVVALAVVI